MGNMGGGMGNMGGGMGNMGGGMGNMGGNMGNPNYTAFWWYHENEKNLNLRGCVE